jgi:hypothetical protein
MASQLNDGSGIDRVLHDNDDDWLRVYFNIAIPSSPHLSEYALLGRLTFRLVPPSHQLDYGSPKDPKDIFRN